MDEAETAGVIRPTAAIDREGEGEDGDDIGNLLGVDYAAIDALLADRRQRSRVPHGPAVTAAAMLPRKIR